LNGSHWDVDIDIIPETTAMTKKPLASRGKTIEHNIITIEKVNSIVGNTFIDIIGKVCANIPKQNCQIRQKSDSYCMIGMDENIW
jgi:hypothetical protein